MMTSKEGNDEVMARELDHIKLFYCYARKDRGLRDELEKHLEPLKRLGQITTWYDREIEPGREWKREIDYHLNTADLVLLLISPNFLRSDYCYGVEMQRALEKHEAGKARVIPVILRPVDWQGTPLSKLQVLPTEGKPISTWRNRDEAFREVAQGIRMVVETLLPQRTLEVQDAAGVLAWFQRLKNERLKRGWTVAFVCGQLAISQASLRRWEAGGGFPGKEFRQRLCDLYEKSAKELGFEQELAVRERLQRLGRE
jgi:hypothetical protein